MSRRTKTVHYDLNDFDLDPLAWSMSLNKHHCGQFSMAVVQSNVNMEDHSEVKVNNGVLFVGVYDGYKGDTASNYIKNHIFQTLLRHIQENDNNMSMDVMRKVVSETEAGFIEFATRHYEQHRRPKISVVSSGCLICLIERRTLYLANVGDSRAILCSQKGVGPIKILRVNQMVKHHNFDNRDGRDELIKLHIGVKDLREISRCIGYAYLKKAPFTTWRSFEVPWEERVTSTFTRPLLSAEPGLYSRVLKDTDKFIIFGSSGFWKFVTNEEAVEIVNASQRDGIAKRLATYALQIAAEEMKQIYRDILHFPKGYVVSGSRRRHFQGARPDFHDDITVIVIFLDKKSNGGVSSEIMSYGGHFNAFQPSYFRCKLDYV